LKYFNYIIEQSEILEAEIISVFIF
jgi:hypothetical protein